MSGISEKRGFITFIEAKQDGFYALLHTQLSHRFVNLCHHHFTAFHTWFILELVIGLLNIKVGSYKDKVVTMTLQTWRIFIS